MPGQRCPQLKFSERANITVVYKNHCITSKWFCELFVLPGHIYNYKANLERNHFSICLCFPCTKASIAISEILRELFALTGYQYNSNNFHLQIIFWAGLQRGKRKGGGKGRGLFAFACQYIVSAPPDRQPYCHTNATFHPVLKLTPDFPQSEIAATNFDDSGRSLGEELGEELGEICCAFSCFIRCAE